jgi:hypothetical protein
MLFRFLSLALAITCSPLSAAIIVPSPSQPDFGWTRGDSNTSYSGWNIFTDDDNNSMNGFQQDSSPEFSAGTFGPASIAETLGNSVISSTNNLYALTGPVSFLVTVPSVGVGGGFTRLVAQFRTLGTEIEYNNIRLDGVAPTAQRELERTIINIPGGAPGQPTTITRVDYLASWNINSLAAQHVLTFGAAASNHSLDQLHIDLVAVPEPATLSTLAVAGCLATWHQVRRRRKASRRS